MFNIVGAGMAGLLAGALLKDQCSMIYEAADELPNNHTALLRFGSNLVGDALGIPFREVKVMKSVHSELPNEIARALSYSFKTNGKATLRSIVSAKGEVEKRYISPPHLIKAMASKCESGFKFGSKVTKQNIELWNENGAKTISTIPMPLLAKILNYDGFEENDFRSAKGWTLRVNLLDVDVCATIYFPDAQTSYYRASITDQTLIVEFAAPDNQPNRIEDMERLMGHPNEQKNLLIEILKVFGLSSRHIGSKPKFSSSQYAKILPCDEKKRTDFIIWATDNFGIYSLGRFATWRPGLMTDDQINDIALIQKMSNRTDYNSRK